MHLSGRGELNGDDVDACMTRHVGRLAVRQAIVRRRRRRTDDASSLEKSAW